MDTITPLPPQSQSLNSQPPVLPPHHVSTSLKLFLLAFGIILVATLGYLVWQANHSSTDSANDSLTHQKTTAASTADWKTYSSTKYSFSFKYPAKYVATSHSNDSSIILAEGDDGHWVHQLDISTNSGNKTLTELTADSSAGYVAATTIITNTKMGKLAAKEIVHDAHDYGNTQLIAVNGVNILTLSTDTATAAEESELASLLTTFTFTN